MMHSKKYRIIKGDDPFALQQLTHVFAQVFNLPASLEAEQSHPEV